MKINQRQVARVALALAAVAVIAGVALYVTGLPWVVRLIPVVGPAAEPLFRQRLTTVPGPESPELREAVSGCIVYDVNDQPGERISIRVVPLPHGDTRLESWPIRGGWVHALAGPDRDGHLTIVEDRLFSKPPTHLLKVLSVVDDSTKTLFERPGSALWDDKIGEHVALSAAGGFIAVVTTLQPVQMRSPDAYLRTGRLEVWDLKTQGLVSTVDDVLDDSLSWFPDGKRLAVVKLTRRPVSPASGNDDFGMWERVPVVHVWNLESGPVAVGLGWHPVVSSDGEAILAFGYEEHSRLLDPRSGAVRPVEWPGRYSTGGVVAVVHSHVLFRGLLTEGAQPMWTTTGSPLASRWQLLPIKVAEFNTHRFATLTEAFDPRHDVSFGPADCTRKGRTGALPQSGGDGQ